MTETKMLIGSLSNDLFRVASLTYSGSTNGAKRFAHESKRWSFPLLKLDLPKYLFDIVEDVSNSDNNIDMETAEKYLMYGVLLQNYCLYLT